MTQPDGEIRLGAVDKLGPSEILAPIGAGGMGEVYRARDPRLARAVAMKVSAGRFSERFEKPTPSRRSIIPTSARSTTSGRTTWCWSTSKGTRSKARCPPKKRCGWRFG
jgi:hypothetical protein